MTASTLAGAVRARHLAALLGSVSLVQAAVSAELAASAADSDEELAEVVVTATGTNIAGVKPVGSEIVTLDAEQIRATGLTDLGQVLRTIPQIQDSSPGFIEGGTTGYANSTQGNALNLRGMGTAATLLLVDGRRLTPTGASSSYTEANVVPLAAIERVEVVADGSSALYGADAVAGVVNYVLKNNYQGAEVTLRYGDQGGYYDEWSAGITAGTGWRLGERPGNVLLTFQHSDRSRMVQGSHPLLRQDLRRYGGPDSRLSGANATPGAAPNIFVATPDPDGFGPLPAPVNPTLPSAGANNYYGLPLGTNGVGLTYANLLVNQPHLSDAADLTDYLGAMKRDQLLVRLNQEVNDWLRLSLDGMWTQRDTRSRGRVFPPGVATVTLPADSPWYVTGIPDTTSVQFLPPTFAPVVTRSALNVQYDFTKDLGQGQQTNTSDGLSLTAGASARLGGGWRGDFYYTYGSEDICGVCNYDNYINVEAFNYQVAQQNINPLNTAPLSAAQIATFTGSNTQFGHNRMHDVSLKFNGPLFDLPAGRVRGAIGMQYQDQSYWQKNTSVRGTANVYTVDTDRATSLLERDVKSLFAELYVPLVGAGAGLPLVKALNLSAALRYDDYSDAGDTTNPKVGLVWELNDSVALRGSWGTSFRAPNLIERNLYSFSSAISFPLPNSSGNPAITNAFPGFTVPLLLIGNAPNLGPETAETWSVGVDLAPVAVDGLRLSATYYAVDYKDRISSPPAFTFLSSPQNAALYGRYITPISNPGSCVHGDPSTYDPLLRPYTDVALYGAVGNYCDVRVVLDGRLTNIAGSRQDGMDLQLGYSFNAAGAYWSVGASLNRIFTYEETTVEGAPAADQLDLYYSPVSVRGRGFVNWNRGAWGANLFINYTGGYLNNQPATIDGVRQPEARVGSWTTADAGVSYSTPPGGGRWLGGARLGLNVFNVTDRGPPIVFTAGGSAVNMSRSNPYGRTWAVSLTKQF